MTNEDPIAVSASSYARLLLESNMKVKEINHSHPIWEIGTENPSGYGHNPTANNMYSEPNPYRIEGDYHSMRLLIDGGEVNGVKLKGFGDKARAINFRVFNPVSKTYIKYDENKAVKQQ